MIFYHGTTTSANIDYKLLPPESTNNLSEDGRKKNLDKVFFTTDLKYAKIYAGRSVHRFGGNPIILRVVAPNNLIEKFSEKSGCNIFTAPYAFCEEFKN